MKLIIPAEMKFVGITAKYTWKEFKLHPFRAQMPLSLRKITEL